MFLKEKKNHVTISLKPNWIVTGKHIKQKNWKTKLYKSLGITGVNRPVKHDINYLTL